MFLGFPLPSQWTSFLVARGLEGGTFCGAHIIFPFMGGFEGGNQGQTDWNLSFVSCQGPTQCSNFILAITDNKNQSIIYLAFFFLESESVSFSIMSNSLWPHGLQSARLLCPWDSPGKNTAMGSHSFLQEIFPTQGSNSGLLHWQVDSLTFEPPEKTISWCIQ